MGNCAVAHTSVDGLGHAPDCAYCPVQPGWLGHCTSVYVQFAYIIGTYNLGTYICDPCPAGHCVTRPVASLTLNLDPSFCTQNTLGEASPGRTNRPASQCTYYNHGLFILALLPMGHNPPLLRSYGSPQQGAAKRCDGACLVSNAS
jgi:hypothetical protein